MKKITEECYLTACETLMCGAVKKERFVVSPRSSCNQFGWWPPPIRAGKLAWVELRVYDDRAFRLAAKVNSPPYELQARFTRKLEFPRYQFELSFAPQEIRQVAREFVRFVESAFTECYWQWPLFTHDRYFPHYAWSKAGNKLFAHEETLAPGKSSS
jgi:hypothetical protein